MRARQKKSLWLTLWRLRKLRPSPAHRRQIDFAILEWLGESKRVTTLRIFCRLRRRALRAHVETWGQVGYAFNACQRFGAVVSWMRDWRERPDAPPWMRLNLIQALYSRKKVGQAREALQAALGCPPDHTHDKLLVWQACEHALDGDTDAAIAMTDLINTSSFSSYDQALAAFTQCMIRMQKASPESRRDKIYDAKVRLREEVEKLPAICSSPALAHFYRRTLRRIGSDSGSLWLQARSYLPLLKPSSGESRSSTITVTPGMIWLIILVLSGVIRGCAAASP
jgi:hypothetical protein